MASKTDSKKVTAPCVEGQDGVCRPRVVKARSDMTTADASTLKVRFTNILSGGKRVAPEIIDAIFEDALNHRASDIHFEPQEKEVMVRFRVDGVLQQVGVIPKENYENILNRLKVLAHLPTDEHFSAQDGSIRYKKEELSIDLRLSIVPVLDGEKVALRLLHGYIGDLSLDQLGFSQNDQKILTAASKKPFGMILVTGPTGSGKTTTLYALLNILNEPGINITSIEDPVEYKIAGANQIQVNLQTNLTFAKGLRSIVRQDPDIVLVGEIRDRETAEIAVNAALTGHLLLSTFHANDAATSIPRLLDMGVEPFLLTSTLEIIVAQRLVRRLCEKCGQPQTFTKAQMREKYPLAASYIKENSLKATVAKGCSVCSGTGYHGRVGIFEFLPITRELQDLILKNPSTKQLWELARKQGAHSLFEDGMDKVAKGVTTIDEVLRVAAPPYLEQ